MKQTISYEHVDGHDVYVILSDDEDSNLEDTKSPTNRSVMHLPPISRNLVEQRSLMNNTSGSEVELVDAKESSRKNTEKEEEDGLSRCLSCDVPFARKNDDDSETVETDLDDRPLCYSIHPHPLLSVVTCASCVNYAISVESDVQTILRKRAQHIDKDSNLKGETENGSACDDSDEVSLNHEMDICSWCAGGVVDERGEDYDLLLCDYCPRAFCKRCVALASGKDIEPGLKAVDLIVKDNMPWMCIFCKPPQRLLQLQQFIMFGKSHNENKCKVRDSDEDEGSCGTDVPSLALAQEVNDLTFLEESYQEAEKMLEDSNIERVRNEVSEELTQSYKGSRSKEELCEEVENEIQAYVDQWRHHHARIAENICSRQEKLFHSRLEFDDSCFYKFFNGGKIIQEEKEPTWKVTAECVMNQRDKDLGFSLDEVKGASGYTGRIGKQYIDFDELSESQLHEIEDINETDNALAIQQDIITRTVDSFRRTWGAKSYQERDILTFKKALEAENQELQILRIQQLTRHTGDADDEEKDRSLILREHVCLGKSHAFGLSRNLIHCRKVSYNRGRTKLNKRASHNNRSESISSSNVIHRKRLSNALTDAGMEVRSKKRINPTLICPGFEPNIEKITFPDSSIILEQLAGEPVSIALPIATALKEHQIAGIRFMWENVMACKLGNKTAVADECEVQGCILAHCMGLGKTLQAIALIHCISTHPSMFWNQPQSASSLTSVSSNAARCRILIVVPVNALPNWQKEIETWVDQFNIPKLTTHTLNDTGANSTERDFLIQSWLDHGGVLFTTGATLLRFVKPVVSNKELSIPRHEAFISPGPDLIVIDEAHLVMTSTKTEMGKLLNCVKTRRRILLTGTPIQNNLKEYYYMANWVKPGCLGPLDDFERLYVNPIMESMLADATPDTTAKGESLLSEISKRLASVVHRVSANILADNLPFMQQVVIHLRQSKVQSHLYRAFQQSQKANGNSNFLNAYHKLFPVNNHPGCLLIDRRELKRKSALKTAEISSDAVLLENIEEEAMADSCSEEDTDSNEWWEEVYRTNPHMGDIKNGGKLLITLHIIANAELVGEKVLLFSQSLRTLDYIESILETSDWGSKIPSFPSTTYGQKCGSWKRNTDYLRIDGSTTATQRSDLVRQFSGHALAQDRVKLFLISSKAGGVGINLVTANRVILYDSHWNPAVDLQAIYRCYRFGQTKPVYVYRLLTEGTMEEKVYSRSVNKTSLSLRVIDQRCPERNFTASELTNLLDTDTWVQCDRCNKWRMLPPDADLEQLPDKWYCEDNVFDKDRSSCDAPERDDKYYYQLYKNRGLSKGHLKDGSTVESAQSPLIPITNEVEKAEFTKRDLIFSSLLSTIGGLHSNSPTSTTSATKLKQSPVNSIISKYYFHDSLVKDEPFKSSTTDHNQSNLVDHTLMSCVKKATANNNDPTDERRESYTPQPMPMEDTDHNYSDSCAPLRRVKTGKGIDHTDSSNNTSNHHNKTRDKGSCFAVEVHPEAVLKLNLTNDPMLSDTSIAHKDRSTLITLRHPGNTDQHLAFKIKTTRPERYCVRPAKGVIAPGGTTDINIVLADKQKQMLLESYRRYGASTLDNRHDKFLVQSCPIPDDFLAQHDVRLLAATGSEIEIQSGKNVSDALNKLWNGIDSSNKSIASCNKKIEVKFVVGINNDTPIHNSDTPVFERKDRTQIQDYFSASKKKSFLPENDDTLMLIDVDVE